MSNDQGVEDEHEDERENVVDDQGDVIPRWVEPIVARRTGYSRSVVVRETREYRQVQVDQCDGHERQNDESRDTPVPVKGSTLPHLMQGEEPIDAHPNAQPGRRLGQNIVVVGG